MATISHSDLLATKAVGTGSEALPHEALERWFGAKFGEDMGLASIAPPSAETGFSSEIYVVGLGGEGRRRYVLKRHPPGERMFQGRDFAVERRLQEILATRTALPVPAIVGWEDDRSILGERFYVMTLIEGRTPPTNPSPHAGGMLTELTPDTRRRLWFSGLARLAELHRHDPAALGAGFLARRQGDSSEFAANLEWWERLYESTSHDRPLPVMTETVAWLRKNAPREDRVRVLWGDARIGNMLFDDAGECVAMIDWELASLGDPLQDLAYWTYSDDHFAAIAGGALPGWPTLEETLERYEQAAGIPVDRRHFAFYRVYAGYWIVCTLARLVKLKKACGQLPSTTRVDERFSPVRFLEAELGRI